MSQVVTYADLEHGWLCETCRRPFAVGDNAYGVLEALTSDGMPIEGGWRCLTCWTNDVPVPESERPANGSQ